jgi:hypothetical protein
LLYCFGYGSSIDSHRHNWHFQFNNCLRLVKKTSLDDLVHRHVILYCYNIFTIHSLLLSRKRPNSRHKHDCMSHFNMGFHSLHCSEKKNSRKLNLAFLKTLKKVNCNLFISINKLLVFSYFNKAVSLCKSCYSP